MILEIWNPVESIATIALVEVPVIPSISPDTFDVILTAFPTPLMKSISSISAVPPSRDTPVPICWNPASSTIKSPVELMPAVACITLTSDNFAVPLTLTPSLSTLSTDKPSMSAMPETSMPIKQSSTVRDFAASIPSTIAHDLALDIVTLSSIALPLDVISRESHTPALWPPGLDD